MRQTAALLLLPLLSGCFAFPVYDETLAEPYHLVATDVTEDAIVCRDVHNGCMGDGLPGPMIFAAGGNERYIVAARHPSEFGKPTDRSKSEYYFLVRKPSDEGNVLHGPLTRTAFEQAKVKFGLPDFTTHMD